MKGERIQSESNISKFFWSQILNNSCAISMTSNGFSLSSIPFFALISTLVFDLLMDLRM